MSRRRLVIIIALLALYVGSYLALSRHGYAQAQGWCGQGFYFFPPRDSALWRSVNYGCVVLYYPLIVADNEVGTGMWPASEPLWELTK